MRVCNLGQHNSRIGEIIIKTEVFDMPLLTIVLTLVVVGVLLWLVNTYIPMAGSIKSILNAVVVIVVVVWLLDAFGLLSSLRNFRVGS
jgi:hypothetical protein